MTSEDRYLPLRMLVRIGPDLLGFRLTGLCFVAEIGDWLESLVEKVTWLGEIFVGLSGGTLNCRTSLDPCPKNHSPRRALIRWSNFLKSSPVRVQ